MLLPALLCGCATVPPGYAAVLLTAGAVRNQPLDEGVHVLPPLASVDLFDLRGQERDADLIAITADGAPVAARTSLVTYSVARDELVALDREVGPNYYEVIVRPIIAATVRRVIAAYRADQLDTPTIRQLQADITRLAAERMRPYHVILDSVDLRTLAVLLSPATYRSVVDVGVLEQRVLSTPQRLEIARQRGQARLEAARALAASHALVAPTLTPGVLADEARRAELQLLTSPTTQVVFTDPSHSSILEVAP